MKNIIIDHMLKDDWEQVKCIYLEGIDSGNATFQTKAPSWQEWDNGHLQDCRLVARYESNILGWAALTPVSSSCAYAGVAEVSVYVREESNGNGVGSLLLSSLIEQSERKRIWTLQAGIFPENIPSLKLHYKFGFKDVGRRERIGQMNGVWRDVLLLERRSNVVGID